MPSGFGLTVAANTFVIFIAFPLTVCTDLPEASAPLDELFNLILTSLHSLKSSQRGQRPNLQQFY